MEIKVMPIADLMTPDYHPRKKLKPGDGSYERLKKSILEFGYIDPVVWNRRTGHIVSGVQRIEVLEDIGFTATEVSIVDLSIEKEKALNIALNNLAGEWDMPLLKDLIIELETYDFDIELTGFSKAEIEKLLGRDVIEDDFDADAEADKIKEPVSRRGDIYQLGRHRLMCGDSTIAAEMDKLMDRKKADR
jgi:ParB-like chromosome segregation protein Spo0J